MVYFVWTTAVSAAIERRFISHIPEIHSDAGLILAACKHIAETTLPDSLQACHVGGSSYNSYMVPRPVIDGCICITLRKDAISGMYYLRLGYMKYVTHGTLRVRKLQGRSVEIKIRESKSVDNLTTGE